MYKLYYSPGSCSMAIHILLNEIGAQFELVDASISSGKNKSKEFLAINPRGNVPVLDDNGLIIREGVAILSHILDSNKNDLLPEAKKERAKTLEWLCFANSSLHPAYSRLFFMMRVLGNDFRANALYQPAIAQIQKYWDELEEHFAKHQYLCNDKCSIADILVTVIANWSRNFGDDIKFGPNLRSYFGRIISRPSYKKALEVEGVNYVYAA